MNHHRDAEGPQEVHRNLRGCADDDLVDVAAREDAQRPLVAPHDGQVGRPPSASSHGIVVMDPDEEEVPQRLGLLRGDMGDALERRGSRLVSSYVVGAWGRRDNTAPLRRDVAVQKGGKREAAVEELQRTRHHCHGDFGWVVWGETGRGVGRAHSERPHLRETTASGRDRI